MRWKTARKWSIRILRIAVLVYLGVGLFFMSVQKWFIFPGTRTHNTAEAQLHSASDTEILRLHTPDGTEIVALFGKSVGPENPATCPTILLFYGNAQCAADFSQICNHARRLGANVVVPDFPGYGMSGGRASEAGCYAAADAVYDWAMSRPDLDHDKIISAGWSLGSAVAVDLASRRKVAALLIFSPFTSMRDMAHNFLPWLPTSLLVNQRFDSLRKIPTIACPILIVHGQRDDLVPPEMSERLHQAARSSCTRLVIESAGHNDLFDVGGAKLWQNVGEFVKSKIRE